MTTDMVGSTSPQINNWLLNPQSSQSNPEKVRKQSQECPLMANEKKKWLDSQLWLHAHAHGLCPSTHKILEFQADRILTSLLALEVSGDLCVLLKKTCIKHSGKQQSQNSSQPITGLLKAQGPTLFCTVSQRWNKLHEYSRAVRIQEPTRPHQEEEADNKGKCPVAPNLSGTADWFSGRSFFP